MLQLPARVAGRAATSGYSMTFDLKACWIDLDGVSLRYIHAGEGACTFVLLHELGGSLESWLDVIPLLTSRGHVLALDLRGAGMSQSIAGKANLDVLVDDVAKLVQALSLPEPLVLAGCAVGGAVALAFAAAVPERTAGVVAMSPAVGVPPERAAGLLRMADRIEQEGSGLDIDQRLATTYPPELRSDRSRFEQLRARRMAAGSSGVAAMMRMLSTLDMSEAIARIACPVLLLAGEFDRERPPATVQALAHKIRQVEFRSLPTGHFMSVQTPDLVGTQIIEFASRCTRPAAGGDEPQR